MEKTITGIEKQKNNPNRLNVNLDDEFAFSVSRFVGAWLSEGDTLSEGAIDKLVTKDAREKAYQKALQYISYQRRTNFEVRQKLSSLGFSEVIIESIIPELSEKNYLDDRQFAEDWIATRAQTKPRSHKMFTYELRKKQVGETVIANAIKDAPTDEELAHSLGLKYLRRYAHLDDVQFQKKMEGVLARRAFPFSVIKNEIKALMNLKNG